MKNKGNVYLLAEWGTELRYKIGVTKNDVAKRVKQLKTGNSNDIKIINTYQSEHYRKIEGMLHRKFNHVREEGEWFTLTDEEVASFLGECKKAEDTLDFLYKNNSLFN